jgi:hypothetical protein
LRERHGDERDQSRADKYRFQKTSLKIHCTFSLMEPTQSDL